MFAVVSSRLRAELEVAAGYLWLLWGLRAAATLGFTGQRCRLL